MTNQLVGLNAKAVRAELESLAAALEDVQRRAAAALSALRRTREYAGALEAFGAGQDKGEAALAWTWAATLDEIVSDAGRSATALREEARRP